MGNVRRATPGRRTYAGRPLNLTPGTHGYLVVKPVRGGRNVQRYVHELVAEAFLGERPSGFDINHRDGDKHNNVLENLEYVSHAENMAHASRHGLSARGERHGASKLTAVAVVEIRRLYDERTPLPVIAEKFGVARSTVCQIGRRQRWVHV